MSKFAKFSLVVAVLFASLLMVSVSDSEAGRYHHYYKPYPRVIIRHVPIIRHIHHHHNPYLAGPGFYAPTYYRQKLNCFYSW